MYALIQKSDNAILRLANEGKDLAPEKPFYWTACPETTTLETKFDGTNFYDKPSPLHVWDGAAWVLDQAAKDDYDAKVAQQSADSEAKMEAKADAVINYLVTHTPAEINNYIQANVTDLASAKKVLAKLAVAVSVIARNELR
jgi:hypothetical protein